MGLFRRTMVSLVAFIVVFLLLGGKVCGESIKTGVITGSVVNFREKPSTSSKILAQFKKGTKVTITGSEGIWYKVSYTGTCGWIHGDYVSIRDESIMVGIVTGTVVNVRNKPEIPSVVLTQVKKGAKVDIIERNGVWFRIAIGDEKYGFIHSDYVLVESSKVSRGADVDAGVPERNLDLLADTGADGLSKEDGSVNGQSDQNGTAGGEADTDGNIGEGKETGDETDDLSEDDIDELLRQEIIDYAKTLLGVKYVYGGSTTKGFDCSGFVCYVFKHFGITLERTSKNMGKYGAAVKKADLKPGDLVFFDTNGGLNGINHVGIYIGNGSFIHASSATVKRVTVNSLNDKFYSSHYMRGRDYLTPLKQ